MNEISQIKQYASRNAVPIMKDEGMEFMCSLIRDNKFVRILEIGSAIGYSAIQFASAAENVEVTTVEIDIDRYSKAVRNILDCGLKDRIKINCADALDWVPEEGSQFDLIFIDAAKAQYIKFFQKFKKYLAPGGVIVSDNLAFHGMVNDFSLTHNYSTIKLLRKIKKYVSFLKLNPEFNTEFFDVGDGVSVSRKNMEFLKLNFTQLESREATSYFSVANGGGGYSGGSGSTTDTTNNDVVYYAQMIKNSGLNNSDQAKATGWLRQLDNGKLSWDSAVAKLNSLINPRATYSQMQYYG